jgi:phosphinothricin acetyltransferase
MAKGDWRAVSALRTAALKPGQGAVEAAPVAWTTWDRAHLEVPRLVGRLEDRVVGWAALAPVSPLAAYAGVAEVRIHVDPVVQRCGIGRHLLTRLIREAEACGIWSL